MTSKVQRVERHIIRKGESKVLGWGIFITFVTGVAMAVKAAFTDDKKEDQK